MSLSIDLQNKVALITGASQGIGAEMARVLHNAGASVVINHAGFENTREDAEKLADELNPARDRSTLVLAGDVSNAEHVQTLMEVIQHQFGGLDILINNAGILRDRTIAKMSLEEWQSVIDVNLTGVFHCCKYGLEIMRDGGAIVNLSSIAAIMGFYGQTNYAAAKGGVASMTKVLSRETGRRNIRVNAIAPGVIETAMAAQIPQNVRDEMLKNVPLGRFGETREIADVALFLCSDLASYVTGQIIEVNGGWRG
jgi:3-oxoacyl-[acyl-carrier protein] reductase